MAFHIKKQSVLLDSKTVYYKGDSKWTDTYADRKSYSTKTAANAVWTDAIKASWKTKLIADKAGIGTS